MLGTYLSTRGSISTCHHLSQQAQFRCQMFINVSAWISWKLQTTHMTKDSGSPGSIP